MGQLRFLLYHRTTKCSIFTTKNGKKKGDGIKNKKFGTNLSIQQENRKGNTNQLNED